MTDTRGAEMVDASTPSGGEWWSPIAQRYVTQAERIAAARVQLVVDEKRGVETPAWIVELAKQSA